MLLVLEDYLAAFVLPDGGSCTYSMGGRFHSFHPRPFVVDSYGGITVFSCVSNEVLKWMASLCRNCCIL